MSDSDQPQVGVLLPTREQAITGSFAGRPLISFAQQAELLGFDSLWTGDSLLARPRLDPIVVLAAAAAATSRITLGTAAITPALRHPLIAANMITSLDHVSSGRLVLGVGSGFPMPETELEFAAVGASFTGRAARLDETTQLWQRAWASTTPEGVTDFTGKYWQATGLDRLPDPARPGGPPLWLAGSDTPRVLARVVRYYDGWLPFLPSAQAYAKAWQQIQVEATAAGRAPGAITAGMYATITVNPNRAAAQAELEDYLGHYYGRSLDQMSRLQAYGWGTPEECADWLAGYVRAGARHIIIRVGSLDAETQLKDIASTVLPVLRAAR
jgi:alkanesulfonate monooxygenase SsuD/methylene tetrahydromethanopterin reductase-like flavin-dependent oxidoreductase (luciferase family)